MEASISGLPGAEVLHLTIERNSDDVVEFRLKSNFDGLPLLKLEMDPGLSHYLKCTLPLINQELSLWASELGMQHNYLSPMMEEANKVNITSYIYPMIDFWMTKNMDYMIDLAERSEQTTPYKKNIESALTKINEYSQQVIGFILQWKNNQDV